MKAVILAILLLASTAQAQTYYADLTADLTDSGYVQFTGNTNHPLLSQPGTDKITYKRADYWLMNLTTEETFSNYVIEYLLPPDASVNYVKSAGPFRIESSDGRIDVKTFGQNQSLNTMIQYSIVRQGSEDMTIPAILAAAILGLVVILKINRLKKTTTPTSIEEKLLTERQRQILEIVKSSPDPVNQAFLCEKLGLPKSSVSRNIETLAERGLIRKQRVGMSTLLAPVQEEK